MHRNASNTYKIIVLSYTVSGTGWEASKVTCMHAYKHNVYSHPDSSKSHVLPVCMCHTSLPTHYADIHGIGGSKHVLHQSNRKTTVKINARGRYSQKKMLLIFWDGLFVARRLRKPRDKLGRGRNTSRSMGLTDSEGTVFGPSIGERAPKMQGMEIFSVVWLLCSVKQDMARS